MLPLCVLLCLGAYGEAGDELIEGVGEIESFESLRGDFSHSLYGDYYFSLSPDESWLVGNRRLLHLPSQRQWDLADADLGSLPNCFSADSTTLLGAASALTLDPGMAEIRPRPMPERNPSLFSEGAFLDSENMSRGPSGEPLARWWERENRWRSDRGEWIRSATTLYEAAQSEHHRSSFLILTPPGTRKGISYAPAIAYWRDYFARMNAEVGNTELGVRFEALRKESERLALELPYQLDHLAISPDGKFLAAIGGPTMPNHGFLIPLDRGGLAAYPFAKNVYGRMIWSRDSKRLYFLAQPIARAGNGTVHRLTIDPSAMPSTIPETELSAEQLAVPSPTALDRQLRASEAEGPATAP